MMPDVGAPEMPTDIMMELTLAMLGLAGLRTVEKLQEGLVSRVSDSPYKRNRLRKDQNQHYVQDFLLHTHSKHHGL